MYRLLNFEYFYLLINKDQMKSLETLFQNANEDHQIGLYFLPGLLDFQLLRIDFLTHIFCLNVHVRFRDHLSV